MKRVADIVITIIVAVAVFTLASYTNIWRQFFISQAAYLVGFFLAGVLIGLFYNKRHVLIAFCSAVFVLFVFTFIVGDFLVYQILNAIAICLGFSLGFFWRKWKLVKRTSAALLLIGFYLLSSFYIVPRYQYNLISATKGEFENKQARDFFQNIVLKDSLGNLHNDFLQEGKVYLVEFYFRNCRPCRVKELALERLRKEIPDTSFQIVYVQSGKIDDFETYLLSSRGKKNIENRFYDEKGILASNFKIKGFPFGLIIDKKGVIRQTANGFGPGITDLFISRKKPFITRLLNEN